MERQEGTLEADRAERNPELLENRIAFEGLGLRDRHALHDRREHGSARLADCTALSLEPDFGDPLGAVHLQVEDDLVPTQRVRVLRIEARTRERALVPRVLVVVQDVLLVEVGSGHQANTSWTFRIPAINASTSSRSL